MRDLAEFIARGAIYALTACLSVLLGEAFVFAVIVALAGSGAFTSDPPPAHPAWIAAMLFTGIWGALQCGVLRLHRLFLWTLDRLTVPD